MPNGLRFLQQALGKAERTTFATNEKKLAAVDEALRRKLLAQLPL
jgi:hypothetical protein